MGKYIDDCIASHNTHLLITEKERLKEITFFYEQQLTDAISNKEKKKIERIIAENKQLISICLQNI